MVNERTTQRFMGHPGLQAAFVISNFTCINNFNQFNMFRYQLDLDMLFLLDYIMILKFRFLFLYFLFASVPNRSLTFLIKILITPPYAGPLKFYPQSLNQHSNCN